MNEPQKSIIQEFLTTGWIYVAIGASAMVARLLTIAERTPFLFQLKKVLVAAISSAIMWSLIKDIDMSDAVKASIYGITGFVATEIIEGIVRVGKMFSKNPIKFLKKP